MVTPAPFPYPLLCLLLLCLSPSPLSVSLSPSFHLTASVTQVHLFTCVLLSVSLPNVWPLTIFLYLYLQQLNSIFWIFFIVDVNECLTGGHDCDEMSQLCVNLQPYFRCECKDGYQSPSANSTCPGGWSLPVYHMDPDCCFSLYPWGH